MLTGFALSVQATNTSEMLQINVTVAEENE
jgi:hypothetical protein